MRRGAVQCGPATSQDGATALVLMASRGYKDTVELLLDRGADLEAKDEASVAGLHWMRGGPRWASRLGRVLAMVMMRRGVVPPWRAGVRGGAGGAGCRQGSDGATRCGDMRA